MSNLPNQNAVHNDDNDDQQQQQQQQNSTNKIPSFNSRITSRSIIKRQQFTETRIANNQACDEIHDLQPKSSSNKKTNSHELMQGNYYDRTRLNNDSPRKQTNEHEQIAISVDDYRDRKKNPTPICSNEKSDRSNSPPFGDTSESIQENIAQSAGKLLEAKKHSSKTTTKSHNQAALSYFPNNDENQQTSSSSSTSSECSTDDDSSPTANEQTTSDIPYERLINDDDDGQTKKSSPKTSSQPTTTTTATTSTSTTNDRTKYFSTNGYNSHGSSITTKSSSDNSGSVRTNSGSDNDEESDEEHYNNSTVTNNKNLQQTSPYRTRDFNNQTSESAPETGAQILRLKQVSNDDSTKQTTAAAANNSTSQTSTNSRSIRSSKKRKQAQQQDVIRTESIPGHRGDRDVDELVMFIGGDSVSVRPTDLITNKTSTKKKTRKTSKSTSSSTIVDDADNNLNEIKQETTESRVNSIEKPKESIQTVREIDSPSSTINNSNVETISEPFVTVTHRRRIVKERRPEPTPVARSIRYPPPLSVNTNEKRRQPQARPIVSNTSSTTIKEETPNSNSPVPSTAVVVAAPPPQPSHIDTTDKPENSPRLSSHSSSSSLSSLLKRQSKPTPPVVFLNKSGDIDLNDVSFGFDIDIDDKQPTTTTEQDSQSSNSFTESKIDDEKYTRKYPQRTNRTSQFYSGQDIRPQQQQPRGYQSTGQTSYIDPLLLYQYNQQRLANYSQQLAYYNLLRHPYLPPQSQYILLPPTTTTTTNANESETDNETNQTSNEPVLVYTSQTGPVYVQATKKPYPQQGSIPPNIYSTPIYYPQHPAYFQPIPSSSSSLLIETKPEHDDLEPADDEHEYSTKTSSQIHQTTAVAAAASDIMSNAIQLVYSRERKTAQTDRFNLDDLTAYLAMKWTNTVDHYLQGDSRIVYVDEQ